MSLLPFFSGKQPPQDIQEKNFFNDELNFDNHIEYKNKPDLDTFEEKDEERNESLNFFDKNLISLPIVFDEKEECQNKQRKNKLKYQMNNIQHKQKFKNSYFPWQKETSFHNNGIIKLHYEIYEFYEFIKLSEHEKQIRNDIINIINSLVFVYNHSWKIETHGSFLYDICLPISEIDLIIIPSSTPKDLLHPLHKISELLIKSNEFAYITVIPIKTPFILLSHKQTNIKLKLSYFIPHFKEANQIILSILDSFPYIKPIIILLEYVLYQKQLNLIQKGGINSYILFHMVFFYIQYLQKMQTNNDNDLFNLGELLIGFLEFYGFNFNHNQLGISLNYGGYFYDKEEKKTLNYKKTLLSIENFQDNSKDLGQNCHNYKKIVDCFRQIRNCLLFPSEYPFISYLAFFIDEDHFIKNRNDIKLD